MIRSIASGVAIACAIVAGIFFSVLYNLTHEVGRAVHQGIEPISYPAAVLYEVDRSLKGDKLSVRQPRVVDNCECDEHVADQLLAEKLVVE